MQVSVEKNQDGSITFRLADSTRRKPREITVKQENIEALMSAIRFVRDAKTLSIDLSFED